jgi:hypothetical protein
MATWTIPVDGADPYLEGAANSDLTGVVQLDESGKPADFDSAATVNSVRIVVRITGSGFSDDTWDVWFSTIQLRDSVNGLLATFVPDVDTGNGNETAVIDKTDSSPDSTDGADYQNQLSIGDFGGGSRTWATYNPVKMADGGTIDMEGGAAETFVVIDYTPGGTNYQRTATDPAGVTDTVSKVSEIARTIKEGKLTPLLDTAILRLEASKYGGSGNWLDGSGSSHDAVAFGTPTFVDAGLESYWDIDQGDGFTVTDHADFDFDNSGNAQSFSALVVYEWDADPATDREYLISHGGEGEAGWYMEVRGDLSDQVRALATDGATSRSHDSASGIDAATKYGVAGIWDGASELTTKRIMVGFADLAWSESADNQMTNYDTTVATDVKIGRRGDDGRQIKAGKLYAVAVFDYDLSENDVDALMVELFGSAGVGVTDTVTYELQTGGFNETATDPVGVTDAVQRVVDAARTITDPVGVTDATQHVLDAVRTVTDPVGVTDDVAVAKTIKVTITDDVGVTDDTTPVKAITQTVTDPVGVTDDTLRVCDLARTVTDPVGVTDVVTPVKAITQTVTDPVGVTDNVADVLSGGTDYQRTATDPVGVTDSTPRVMDYKRSAGSATGRASTGYLDFSGTNKGQLAQPLSNTDSDIPHPTTSMDLRLDIDLNSMPPAGRMAMSIHSDATGSGRAFMWRHDPSTASTVVYNMNNGTSEADQLSSASYWETGRMQYRLVHSGTNVSLYKRDPAVHDLPLANDSNWTLENSTASADNISSMVNPANAPFTIYRRTNGGGMGVNSQWYEAYIKVDGTVESTWGGGEVTLDGPGNEFVDEQAQDWDWNGATDPTQTAGDRGGSGSELVGVTDVVTSVLTKTITVTDPVGVTDDTTTVREIKRTITDPVGVTDAVSRQVDYKRTVTDAVGVTDDASDVISSGLVETVTDNVGVTDQTNAAKTIKVTITDVVGVTDNATPARTLVRSVNERILVGPFPDGYMELPGTDEYVKTLTAPDVSSVSGDLEVIWGGILPDYTPPLNTYLWSQRNISNEGHVFYIDQSPAGRPSLSTRSGGIQHTQGATSSISQTDGQWLWLRVVLDGGTGQVEHFESLQPRETPVDNLVWTSLGGTTRAGNSGPDVSTSSFAIGVLNEDGTDPHDHDPAYLKVVKDGSTLVSEADWRRGPDFDTLDQRADDGVPSLTWEMQGTAPVYHPTTDAEVTRIHTATRTVNETVGVTDDTSYVKTGAGVEIVTETVGVTDAVATVRVIKRTVTDAVGATDATPRVHTATRAVNESVGVTDLASPSVTGVESPEGLVGFYSTIIGVS